VWKKSVKEIERERERERRKGRERIIIIKIYITSLNYHHTVNVPPFKLPIEPKNSMST
jgi:hypothetical protein